MELKKPHCFNSIAHLESNDLLCCLTPLSTIFQYIVAVSFIGGKKQNTWRKLQTCRKSLIKLYRILLYRVHLAMNGIRTHNFSGDKQIAQVVVNQTTMTAPIMSWFLILYKSYLFLIWSCVSEAFLLFVKWAVLQLHHSKTSYFFHEKIMISYFMLDHHIILLKWQLIETCRHVAPLWHIIMTLSQSVFALTPQCSMLWRGATMLFYQVYSLSFFLG